MTRKLKMGLAALVLMGVALFTFGMTAFASPLKPAAPLANCAYWTTDNGISAVAVTSGFNCSGKAFTIKPDPYEGARFENYNAFLSQAGSFVNGPGTQDVKGYHLVGSAKNAFTNGVAVYVYQGPGWSDGSARAFDNLIHGLYPWQ